MGTGVFLCHCRHYQASRLDMAALEQQAASAAGVEWVEVTDLLCDAASWTHIARTVQQLSLDRIVLGACSLAEYEGIWTSGLASCGLPPGMMAVANLRDVAPGEASPELARAISRVGRGKPWTTGEETVNRQVCIIGAGSAGMETALALAELGLEVVLLEKEASIGGLLQQLYSLYPGGQNTSEILAACRQRLAGYPGIKLLTGIQVAEITGQVGNFNVCFHQDGAKGQLTAGALVIATGSQPAWIYPEEWQVSPQIITQSRLEKRFLQEPPEKLPATVAFLLDWGGQSSRLATLTAFKQALLVKQLWGSEVWVIGRYFYVDAPAADELYRQARLAGVVTAKFDRQPLVNVDTTVSLAFADVLLGGEEVELSPDLLVVEEVRKAMPVQLANLRVEALDNVFYYPVRSSRPGIYVIGNLRGVEMLPEIRRSARQAAWEIYRLLGSGKMAVPHGRVEIDASKCAVCLTCVRLCPHQAIELDITRRAALIHEEACSACGICAAECPAKAIQVNGYRDGQVLDELATWGVLTCQAAS